MPDVTSPDGLPFPVVGDNVSPRIAITQLAAAVQTALSSVRTYDNPARVTDFYGTAANIGTVTPKEGDTYQESDGNKILWKRMGGLWVTNENGLYLIRPTSVVNGAVAADGAIEPSGGSTSFSVNGVYTTRFRSYLHKFVIAPGVAMSSLHYKARRAGADIVSADYVEQRNYAAGTGSAASAGSTTNGVDLMPAASTIVAGEFTVSHPAINSAMLFNGTNLYLTSGITGVQNIAAVNSGGANAAFDGFSIVCAQTLAAGVSHVKVYGLA